MKLILDKIILLSKKLTNKSNQLNQIINNNTLSNQQFDDIQNNISRIFQTYFPDPYKPRVNIYSDAKVLIDTVYLSTLNISEFLNQYLEQHNSPKQHEIQFINVNIEIAGDEDFSIYSISKFTFRKVNFEGTGRKIENINTIEFIQSNVSGLTLQNVLDFKCQNSHFTDAAIVYCNVLNFYQNALLQICTIIDPTTINVYSNTVKIHNSVIRGIYRNNINFYINQQYDTTEMFKNTTFNYYD